MFSKRKAFYFHKFLVVITVILLAALSCKQVRKNETNPMVESETKQKVWETVQTLNRIWTVERNVEKLKDYFHSDMVAITPVDRERIQGRKSCIASWKRFVDKAKILEFREIDPKIQLFGEGKFAVVTYYYDMTFEIDGQTVNSGGRDMFVLVQEDGKWWVVADQFSPYPEMAQQ